MQRSHDAVQARVDFANFVFMLARRLDDAAGACIDNCRHAARLGIKEVRFAHSARYSNLKVRWRAVYAVPRRAAILAGFWPHFRLEQPCYQCPKLAAAQAPNPVTEHPERKTAQCTSIRCRVLSRAESGTASEREYAAVWDRTIPLLVSQTSSSTITKPSHTASRKENSPMHEHTVSGAFASGIRNGE